MSKKTDHAPAADTRKPGISDEQWSAWMEDALAKDAQERQTAQKRFRDSSEGMDWPDPDDSAVEP